MRLLLSTIQNKKNNSPGRVLIDPDLYSPGRVYVTKQYSIRKPEFTHHARFMRKSLLCIENVYPITPLHKDNSKTRKRHYEAYTVHTCSVWKVSRDSKLAISSHLVPGSHNKRYKYRFFKSTSFTYLIL